MNKAKIITLATLCTLGCALTLLKLQPVSASSAGQSAASTSTVADAAKDTSSANQQPVNASRAAREEKALQDARRQQLADKEAALAAKELELNKLSAKLEAQVKAMEDSKKRLDESLKTQSDDQKKKRDEKILKMVKLFKTMRGEQAGKMIDSMQENLAMTLLSRLDTKTVAKLAPFISQPRVVKWVTDNLQGR